MDVDLTVHTMGQENNKRDYRSLQTVYISVTLSVDASAKLHQNRPFYQIVYTVLLEEREGFALLVMAFLCQTSHPCNIRL